MAISTVSKKARPVRRRTEIGMSRESKILLSQLSQELEIGGGTYPNA